MKIQSFNKNNLKDITEQIQDKLNELKELGLTIELGNISFDEVSFTSKITCTITEQGNKFEIEYNKYFSAFGMTKDQLGKTFMNKGHKCKFIGFNPKSRTNIAMFEDMVTKKIYVTTAEQIKKYLN